MMSRMEKEIEIIPRFRLMHADSFSQSIAVIISVIITTTFYA